MSLDDGISALIGRIYESAADEGCWEQLLYDIREYLGARCLMQSISDLRHHDMQRSIVIGDARRPDGVNEYREHAYALDPSFRWAIMHPKARFCDTESLIPANDYLEHDWIRWNRDEWIGSTHWVVGYTPPEDELTFGLSVHPWAHDGPLTPQRKLLFRMLFEHMERAIRLVSHPPLFTDRTEALFLIDRLGQVQTASPAALDIIAAGDGLALAGKQLKASDRLATKALNAAIRSALNATEQGGFGGAVAIPRLSGKRDMLLLVSPLPRPQSPFAAFGPAALVKIIRPDCGPSASAVRAWTVLFSLTPAEARLAQHLLSGAQNMRATAMELGISYATARVHLRSLLEKTQTHSQSQLTQLLSQLR